MKYALYLLIPALLAAQTKPSLQNQAKDANFSAFPTVLPWTLGTSLPATCILGQSFYLTTAAIGQNIYACTSTNTWTQQSGAGGGLFSLAMPSIFNVSPTPPSSSATVTLASQTANLVFAGPPSGSAGTPAFRALVNGDLPLINLASKVTGVLPIPNGGTGTATPTMTAGACMLLTGTFPNLTFSATCGANGSAQGSASPAATTLTITHNFNSTSHVDQCVNTSNLQVLPTTMTIGLNTDTLTFSGGLAANTTCTAVAGGGGTGGGGMIYPAAGIALSLGPTNGWGASYAVRGSGSAVQLANGTVTSGNCAKFDASGNLVDNGAPCTPTGGTNAVSLQSFPISAATPLTGQSLVYNGTSYVPTSGQTIPSCVAMASGVVSGPCITASGATSNFTYWDAESGSYTVPATAINGVVQSTNAGAVTIAIPQAGLAGNFIEGSCFVIRNDGTTTLTLSPSVSLVKLGSSTITTLAANKWIEPCSHSGNYLVKANN